MCTYAAVSVAVQGSGRRDGRREAVLEVFMMWIIVWFVEDIHEEKITFVSFFARLLEELPVLSHSTLSLFPCRICPNVCLCGLPQKENV